MDDFIQFEQLLTSEQILLRDNVRRFVDQQIMPQVANWYEQAHFPKDIIKQFAKLGLLGMCLPKEFGGSQADAVSYGLVCQELERGDSGFRSFISVQSALCMHPIYKLGSAEQQQKWLPKMASGECIGCFGLTEADAGSDPGSMQTTAVPVKGGYKLNGSKMWITNAPFADLAIIWAKLEDKIRGFIVETDRDGFTANEMQHKLSMRVSSTGEIILQDCFIPEENLLTGSKGLSSALSCLTEARFGIAWGAMGAAQHCYETALEYSSTRQQFAKAIAHKQLVQENLVNMLTEIVKAQTLNLHFANLKDNDNLNFAMVSLAKRNACREALKIARNARNLLGANGISLEYPVMRHMCNLETVFTYEGTR